MFWRFLVLTTTSVVLFSACRDSAADKQGPGAEKPAVQQNEGQERNGEEAESAPTESNGPTKSDDDTERRDLLECSLEGAAALSKIKVPRNRHLAAHGVYAEALAREEAYRQKLLAIGVNLTSRVDKLTVGDPVAVHNVTRQLGALEEPKQKKIAAFDEKGANAEKKVEEKKVAVAKEEENVAAAQAAERGGFVGTKGHSRPGDRCGSDGCGGNCGVCDYAEVCLNLWCRCVPDCKGKNCGPDGCGGVCGSGSCPSAERCTERGQCVARQTEKSCNGQCRTLPGGPSISYVREKDYAQSPRRGYQLTPVTTMDECSIYIDALKDRTANLDSLIGSLPILQTEVDNLETEIEVDERLQAKLKTSAAEGKKLVAEKRKELRTAEEAVRGGVEAELSQLEEQVGADSTAARAAADRVKENGKLFKDMQKRLEALKGEVEEAKEARPLLVHEQETFETFLEAWKEARAAVEKAQQQLGAAQAALAAAEKNSADIRADVVGKKEALEAEHAKKIEAPTAKLGALTGLAFSAGELPLWGDESGMHQEGLEIVWIRDPDHLRDIRVGVEELLAEYREAWEEWTDKEREQFGSWAFALTDLEDLGEVLDELDATAQRVMALKRNMIAARKAVAETPVK